MRRIATQDTSERPFSVTASSTSSDSSFNSVGGFTVRWASKERVFHGHRTHEDDIWALGMTMVEVSDFTVVYPCSF